MDQKTRRVSPAGSSQQESKKEPPPITSEAAIGWWWIRSPHTSQFRTFSPFYRLNASMV
jgi:hypothetical protein